MGIRVLAIGENVKPQAHLLPGWEDADVVTLDIDAAQNPDILADASDLPERLYEQFDGVFASHVLEHFSYWNSEKVLLGWVNCLKDGGEIHIVVPSWEWACREVLSERPSPAVYPHMFAGHVNQWDVHYSMFTMRKLRQMFEKVGLNVTKAKTGPYAIMFAGVEYPAEQHYICGVKGTPPLKKE